MHLGFARVALILLVFVASPSSSSIPAQKLIREVQMSEEPQLETILFRDLYSILWGHRNTNELEDGTSIDLSLDQHSGSGFKSRNKHMYGFFSASIKLPANYSAGVVTAFYTSNSDEFPQTHDELDFEFLGVVPGMPYILQTNIYSNGSVSTGREERFHLWFDPTSGYHRYSILWNQHHIVFSVDNVPIRQLKRMNIDEYPSKPMSVYATIWDGSSWATSGGKFPVKYSRSPFVASFRGFNLQGRKLEERDLSRKQKLAMRYIRRKFISYSYCSDKKRYPNSLPECSSN